MTAGKIVVAQTFDGSPARASRKGSLHMKGISADRRITLVRHLTAMRTTDELTLVRVSRECWRPVLVRLAALKELIGRKDANWPGFGRTYPVRKRMVRVEYGI